MRAFADPGAPAASYPSWMTLPEPLPTSVDRKADHLAIAGGEGVLHGGATGLEAVRLRHRALPGRDLDTVDLATTLLGRALDAPLLISAMTGGTAEAVAINDRLARAAARHGVAMSLGSARPLLDDPSLLRSYRPAARPPLLLANLGAVGLEPATAARAVELLGADALSVHLNPLQEAVQPEGHTAFADVGDRIAATVAALAPLPVVVKEVGFGLDGADVRALLAAGVAGVDVAGAGGTNWALVEGRRAPQAASVASAFADWGRPTAAALRDAVAATATAGRDVAVIASGGVADGVDAAKCLALGAAAAGLARPLLLAARGDRADEAIATIVDQLRIAVWLTGAPTASALGPEHLQQQG
jgi:isopentenyl-diphosphate delta-isomerase